MDVLASLVSDGQAPEPGHPEPRKTDSATLTVAVAVMSDPKAKRCEVAKRLGLTTTTLYTYVNSVGSLKAAGTDPRGKPTPF